MSGLATLGDAIVPHVKAVLLSSEDGFASSLNIRQKLEKIGVTIEREVRPDRFTAASLSNAEIVVMLEGHLHQGTRDSILSVTIAAGKCVFTLNRKASHDTWQRLAEYTKRKALPSVSSADDASTKASGRAHRTGIAVHAILTTAAGVLPEPEYKSSLAHPIRDMIGPAVESPEYNTWVAEFRRLEAEWLAKQAELTEKVKTMQADWEAAESLYKEEHEKICARCDTLQAALEQENAKSLELRTANEAQEIEIEGLQKELKDARVLGAKVKGAREQWENRFKKKFEDEERKVKILQEAHNPLVETNTELQKVVAQLERELRDAQQGLRLSAYDPTVSDRKIRALLDAFEVGALSSDQVFEAIVRIASGST